MPTPVSITSKATRARPRPASRPADGPSGSPNGQGELHGVADQVEQRLAQPAGVGEDQAQRRGRRSAAPAPCARPGRAAAAPRWRPARWDRPPPGSTSSRPASIREKSITSSSRVDSIRPQARASPSRLSASPGSFSRLSRCMTPSTPFIGVRISWLILARNRALASLAAWAARWASTRASSARLLLVDVEDQAERLADAAARRRTAPRGRCGSRFRRRRGS